MSASSQSSDAPKVPLLWSFAAPLCVDEAALIFASHADTTLRLILPVEVRGRSGSGQSTQRRTR